MSRKKNKPPVPDTLALTGDTEADAIASLNWMMANLEEGQRLRVLDNAIARWHPNVLANKFVTKEEITKMFDEMAKKELSETIATLRDDVEAKKIMTSEEITKVVNDGLKEIDQARTRALVKEVEAKKLLPLGVPAAGMADTVADLTTFQEK